MKLIIQTFGVLIIFAGISMFINPDIIFGWLDDSLGKPSFYWFAIIFRLAMGWVFISTAKESRFPGTMKVFGGLAVLFAIVFIFIGQHTFNDFFSELLVEITSYAPVSGFIDIAVGAFLIYAYSTKKETA